MIGCLHLKRCYVAEASLERFRENNGVGQRQKLLVAYDDLMLGY